MNTTTKCTTTGSTTVTSTSTAAATTSKNSSRHPHPHPTTRRVRTSTVYSTTVQTITSCAPGIKNCPGHVVTRTIAISTTICPVSTDGPEPTHPGGGAGWPKPSSEPSRGPGPHSWGPKPSGEPSRGPGPHSWGPKPSGEPSRGPGPNSGGPKPSITNTPFSTVTIPKGQDRPTGLPHHVDDEPVNSVTGNKPAGASAPAGGPPAAQVTDVPAGHGGPHATGSASKPVATAGANRNGAATLVFSGVVAMALLAL